MWTADGQSISSPPLVGIHSAGRQAIMPSGGGEQPLRHTASRPYHTRPDPTTRVSLLQYCGGGLHIQQHPTSTVSSRAQTRTASAIRVVRQEHVRHPRGHGAAELGGRTKERATSRSHCVELEASYMDDAAGGEARRRCGRRGWSVEGCASPSASLSEVVRAVRPHSGVCQGERERECMWVRVRLQHHDATICEKGSGSREGQWAALTDAGTKLRRTKVHPTCLVQGLRERGIGVVLPRRGIITPKRQAVHGAGHHPT